MTTGQSTAAKLIPEFAAWQAIKLASVLAPTPTTYTPTFTPGGGSISVNGNILKSQYVDWGYKYDLTVAVDNMEFGGSPNYLLISLPVAKTVIKYSCTMSVMIFQNGVGFYGDAVMILNDVAGQEIQIERVSGAFQNAVRTLFAVTGSVWYTP